MVASNIKAILEAALLLPPEDRATIAQELWDSIDSADQSEIDKAWEQEAERRLDQIERGEVELDDVETVLKELEEDLNK